MALLLQHPCLMIAESGAPTRAIRRVSPTRPLWPENPSLKPAACALALTKAVDRLGRRHEDGRTRISMVLVELQELVQGGYGPAGDEHYLALAGLIGLAPLSEQPTGAVIPPFDGGPYESGASSETPVPLDAGAMITGKSG